MITPERAALEDLPADSYLVYDDDHYVVASALAEKLAAAGHEVTYVTPADRVASWSVQTNEQHLVHARLHELGVKIVTAHGLAGVDDDGIILENAYTGGPLTLNAGKLIPVTLRTPANTLCNELLAKLQPNEDTNQISVTPIGDCDAPGLIADAVFAGHRWAREIDQPVDDSNPMRYDRVLFGE